jgi:hypothetical protein
LNKIRSEIKTSNDLDLRGDSATAYCGSIVASGRRNIEVATEQRVHAKFQAKLAQSRIIARFLINRRISKIVMRKMKNISPYASFVSR